MSKNFLFDEFSQVSSKQWKQKIQYDLKGADYNETLVWESPEGIKVKPFYHSDDAFESYEISSGSSSWAVGQSIYAGNAIMANEKAIKATQRGVEKLSFQIPSQEIKINELLKNIDLKENFIYLEMEFLSEKYLQSILDFAGNLKEKIHFNLDVVGHLARTGNWFQSLEKDFATVQNMLEAKPQCMLSVDVSLYQNAGADMAQQLAYALAHANEYLNDFARDEKLAQPLEGRSISISFKVAVGTNYFFEIAKLRALRLLWKTLASEYGIFTECHIIATPTKRNKTVYDYNTNMLRTTTECMAAALGGANTILNLPYDAIYHKDNEFGERIAVNQLLLLKNESYFDKVENPADGAYYIESITNQLAEKALILFKSIESGGGFLKQMKAHTIQRKIQESAQKEQAKFNSKEEVLVGTNKYQNENDKMKNEIELYPFLKINARKTLIQPILEKRLAEELEQKRLDDEKFND